jgi:hypothetical protein
VSRLRKHLSVANVISFMTLFVALSGVAVAAKATLTKNQVKAKNIAKEAVTSPKLKNNAVISAKLATNSVINSKIANGSVASSKLANGSVRSNTLGGSVVTEAKLKNAAVGNSKLGEGAVTSSKLSPTLLAQLLKNVTYVNASSASNSEPNKFATAKCPPGRQAIGGGVRLEGELAEVAVTGSYPLSEGSLRTGWEALAHETGPGQPSSWSVTAFAICAEL